MNIGVHNFAKTKLPAIQEHYKLTAEEVNEIFFASMVSQKDISAPKIRPTAPQSDNEHWGGERWAQVFNP